MTAYEALKNGMSEKQAIKKFHLKVMQVAGLRSALKRNRNENPAKHWVVAEDKKPTLMERMEAFEKRLTEIEALSGRTMSFANRIAGEIGMVNES